MQYYKVWGGQFSFQEYSPADDKVDWSGFYFQHNVKHSLTYLSKKFEDGFELVSLVGIRLRNQELQIVRLENKLYGDGKVSGADKACSAKRELAGRLGISFGEHSGLKLMETLGKHGILLELLDADEYELIVPHRLFSPANFQVVTVAEFKRHPTEIWRTGSYRKADSAVWANCTVNQSYEPYLLAPLLQK